LLGTIIYANALFELEYDKIIAEFIAKNKLVRVENE